MTDAPVAVRVDALIQRVFELDPAGFHDGTGRGDLERWDSLGHLALVEALREEFQVEIPAEQALDMETIADIKSIMHMILTNEAEA